MRYKNIILAALVAFGSLATANAQFQRTPTPNDTLQSVRKLTDGSVVFSIYAPKARTVSVAGDMIAIKKRVYDLYFLASFLVSLSVEILDASPRHL